MYEIDPSLLAKLEQQLGIQSLKCLIGFTEKNFVIATRGGIQAAALREGKDPLQDVGESRVVNIRNFSVIELENGELLLQTQSLKGDDIITSPPTAFGGSGICPCGNPPIPGNPPQCPHLFRIGAGPHGPGGGPDV